MGQIWIGNGNAVLPARLMGCDDRTGSLELGKEADIVVMTPDFQVDRVYVKGHWFAQ